jgi:orotidine-5'-phosphate decarboxylase
MRKPRLIVALDLPDLARIPEIVARLPPDIDIYKVGLELFSAAGPAAVATLRNLGRQVFLDLKLHDIPNTVSRAIRAAARHGVGFITLHAAGGVAMLRAAAEAARDQGPAAPRLIAVTTLTSLTASDLERLGIRRSIPEQAGELAEMALATGMDGLVASALEVESIRQRFGADPLLVTPGIRLPSDARQDQARVATPAEAVRAGSDYLVVGRPILDAADPGAAARSVLDDMQRAG